MTPRRVHIISILVLIGAFPLSAGIIFHSSWLRWTGIVVAGMAFALTFVELLHVVWFWMRAPKPHPQDKKLSMRGDGRTRSLEPMSAADIVCAEFDAFLSAALVAHLCRWAASMRAAPINRS